jgi:hypothetical protein
MRGNTTRSPSYRLLLALFFAEFKFGELSGLGTAEVGGAFSGKAPSLFKQSSEYFCRYLATGGKSGCFFSQYRIQLSTINLMSRRKFSTSL